MESDDYVWPSPEAANNILVAAEKVGLIKPEGNQLYKADAGKLKPRLLFEGMPRSLLLVIAVLSYGEQKYEAHSWKKVESDRYTDAKLRHMLEVFADFDRNDAESGLLHEAHEICNALFLLEQKVEGLSIENFKELLKFNKPPTDHKKVGGTV